MEFIKDDMTNIEEMDRAVASLTKAIRKKVIIKLLNQIIK